MTIDNLTIADTVARGGAGAYGGGGGGAGLGGGLFVASDTADGAAPAQVTLNNVTFSHNSAIGGAGGLGVDGSFLLAAAAAAVSAAMAPVRARLASAAP